MHNLKKKAHFVNAHCNNVKINCNKKTSYNIMSNKKLKIKNLSVSE